MTPDGRVHRVAVLARDQEQAIAIARSKPWWSRALNATAPVFEHDRFWFIVAGGVDRGIGQ